MKKTRSRGHSRTKSLSDKNELLEVPFEVRQKESQQQQQIEELQYRLKAAEASQLNMVCAVKNAWRLASY